jgi:hypothetical protein
MLTTIPPSDLTAIHEAHDDDESLSDADVNDDNESLSDDTTPDQQLNARSANDSIADDSVAPIVVEGKRNRTASMLSNITSFTGKYHVNMLNVGQHFKKNLKRNNVRD